MGKTTRRRTRPPGLPVGPMASALVANHTRLAVLGGGEIGLNTLLALFSYGRFEKYIDPVFVWPDWMNNSKGRYLRHYGEKPLAEDELRRHPDSLLELARQLPRASPEQPLVFCGRVMEQLRMFDLARTLSYPEDQIIKARYDDALFEELIERYHIDAAIVAAFGGHISQRIRKKLHNQIWVCHPGFWVDSTVHHLPEESRGANVFDRIVAERGTRSLQVTMQELEDDWDTGRICAWGSRIGQPFFSAADMGPDRLAERNQKAVSQVAVAYYPLLRYNLLRLLYNVGDVAESFSSEKLVQMKFGFREVQQAKKRMKKRKRKDDK